MAGKLRPQGNVSHPKELVPGGKAQPLWARRPEAVGCRNRQTPSMAWWTGDIPGCLPAGAAPVPCCLIWGW